MTNVVVLVTLSLSSQATNKGVRINVLNFICQMGHLRIRTVHGFWALLGWWKEHRLSGGGFAKGFCTGDLGRTVYFRVVANRSEHMSMFITTLRVIKIVRSNQPKELSELLESAYFREKHTPSSKAPYIYGTLVWYGGRVSAAVTCDFEVFVVHLRRAVGFAHMVVRIVLHWWFGFARNPASALCLS